MTETTDLFNTFEYQQKTCSICHTYQFCIYPIQNNGNADPVCIPCLAREEQRLIMTIQCNKCKNIYRTAFLLDGMFFCPHCVDHFTDRPKFRPRQEVTIL